METLLEGKKHYTDLEEYRSDQIQKGEMYYELFRPDNLGTVPKSPCPLKSPHSKQSLLCQQ